LRRPKLDELEDLVGVSVASSKSDQSEAVQA
jgi:hypothetical protein